MDLQQLYSSTANFWDTISPIIYAHLIFILALWLIVGINPIKLAVDKVDDSRLNEGAKDKLKDIGLWNKLPYIAVLLLIFYCVMFRDLLGLFNLSSYTAVPFTSVSFSELDLWREFKPAKDLSIIGTYGGVVGTYANTIGADDNGLNTPLIDVFALKAHLLAKYQAEDPDHYEKFVGWTARDLGQAITYYRMTVIFCVVALALFLYQMVYRVNSIREGAVLSLRFCFFMAIMALVVVLCAYQVEQKFEQKEYVERAYLVSQITLDPRRLNPSDTHQEQALKNEEVALKATFESLLALPPHYDNDLWLHRWLRSTFDCAPMPGLHGCNRLSSW